MRNFRDYLPEERRNYITLSTGEYYPDILEDACRLYSPVLETFSQLRFYYNTFFEICNVLRSLGCIVFCKGCIANTTQNQKCNFATQFNPYQKLRYNS